MNSVQKNRFCQKRFEFHRLMKLSEWMKDDYYSWSSDWTNSDIFFRTNDPRRTRHIVLNQHGWIYFVNWFEKVMMMNEPLKSWIRHRWISIGMFEEKHSSPPLKSFQVVYLLNSSLKWLSLWRLIDRRQNSEKKNRRKLRQSRNYSINLIKWISTQMPDETFSFSSSLSEQLKEKIQLTGNQNDQFYISNKKKITSNLWLGFFFLDIFFRFFFLYF